MSVLSRTEGASFLSSREMTVMATRGPWRDLVVEEAVASVVGASVAVPTEGTTFVAAAAGE